MSSKKTVLVNKIKQLIDLNGDKVNYDLNFSVTSKDGLPFDTIVVSQAKLDSGEELEYKKVLNGVINGNIVADKDIYQNYFLLLKADKPVECFVEIDIKDIPVNEEFLNQQKMQEQSMQKQQRLHLINNSETKSNFNKSFYSLFANNDGKDFSCCYFCCLNIFGSLGSCHVAKLGTQ